jgi:hypothetical protein
MFYQIEIRNNLFKYFKMDARDDGGKKLILQKPFVYFRKKIRSRYCKVTDVKIRKILQ